MYSTKVIHKNKLVGKGASYITIGDPYDPLSSKAEKNTRIHGKQFSTAVPKKGHIWKQVLFEGKDFKLGPHGKFEEAQLYINTQPPDQRKKGFGIGDATRHDEFCNNTRTEQLRGTLNTEKMIQRRQWVTPDEMKSGVNIVDKYQDKINKLEAEHSEIQDRLGDTKVLELEQKQLKGQAEQLYDFGRKQVTPFNPKQSRDTWFDSSGRDVKRFGAYHRTTLQHGMFAKGMKVDKKATMVCVHTTETFFDRGHLHPSKKIG